MSKRLEEYRLFSTVAWLLIIGFSLFTISLVHNLYTEISAAEYQTVSAATYR